MSDHLSIDIWSDIVCPWCVIGHANFSRAARMLEGQITLDVQWMPFELDPDMPPEGRPLIAHLADRYGKSAAEAAAMMAQVQDVAARAGFPIDFTGPHGPDGARPEAMARNTREAHKLLRFVLGAKGREAQAQIKLALFRAHWNERRDIASRAVLGDIAAAHGFDREAVALALADEALGVAVALEEQRARHAGIRAVPTFVVNQRYVLQGSQEPEGFRSALFRLAAMEAMG